MHFCHYLHYWRSLALSSSNKNTGIKHVISLQQGTALFEQLLRTRDPSIKIVRGRKAVENTRRLFKGTLSDGGFCLENFIPSNSTKRFKEVPLQSLSNLGNRFISLFELVCIEMYFYWLLVASVLVVFADWSEWYKWYLHFYDLFCTNENLLFSFLFFLN